MNEKVAIYCRVSTDEQNILQQRELLVKYCKEKNFYYRTFLDEGISGAISERKQWLSLIEGCVKGEFTHILVVKADRITRSLKYAIWFWEWLQVNSSIKLVCLYDSIDLETPDGYFSFMLNCLLSERELLINRWRSRIGIERAKKEGKYLGGKKGRTWK